MKKLIVLLALLSLFSVTAANADPLRIGYNQWAGFAPVFIAKELGYFEEAGLDVEMREFRGPADTLPPLVSGDLDMALTTPDSVIPINSRGIEAVSIMVMDASHGGDGIIAVDGIETVSDLKGRRVAATDGEVNHLLLMLALSDAGLSGDDITFTNMNADDAGAAFLAGRLDAAVTWEPWLSRAGSEGAGKVIFTSKEVPDMLIDVAAVSPATLEAREEDLRAFTNAVDRAIEQIQSNPEESYRVIARWLDYDAAEIAEMMDGIRVYGRDHNASLFAEGNEEGINHSFERIYEFLVGQSLAEEGLSLSGMLDGRLFEN